MLEDVAHIYPLLKTEISINHPQIDLSHFITTFLTLITTNLRSNATVLTLHTLQQQCHFMGPLERSVSQLALLASPASIPQPDFISKKLDFSSEEDDKQRDHPQQFSEVEFFRKKKPRSFQRQKDSPLKPAKSAKSLENAKCLENALKPTKSMSTIEATPVKKKPIRHKKTPRSERRSEAKTRIETTKKAPLFKKIQRPKRPLERTIYQGSTKQFMPRKGIDMDEGLVLKESMMMREGSCFSSVQTRKKMAGMRESEE